MSRKIGKPLDSFNKGERLFYCQSCTKKYKRDIFVSEGEWDEHIKRCHKDGPNYCGVIHTKL